MFFKVLSMITPFSLYGISYLVASLYAGSFADKMPKSKMIQQLKLLEVFVMAFTLLGLFWESRLLMLISLTAFGFCMSAIRIAKYALIPELVTKKDLLSANALIKGFTFISVLIASVLFSLLSDNNVNISFFTVCDKAFRTIKYPFITI